MKEGFCIGLEGHNSWRLVLGRRGGLEKALLGLVHVEEGDGGGEGGVVVGLEAGVTVPVGKP